MKRMPTDCALRSHHTEAAALKEVPKAKAIDVKTSTGSPVENSVRKQTRSTAT